MALSIKLVMLLPLVMTSVMAAPAQGPQEDVLRALINPSLDGTTSSRGDAGTATTSTNADNMIGGLTLPTDQPIKSIKALRDALAASVKSQLMTSLANMPPEQVTTFTGGANPGQQLSQLNLMGGINNLVNLIVQQILQSLLPRIFGQNTSPATNPGLGFPALGGYNPQPSGGLLGSMGGGSMNPMGMMIPGMMFSFMNNMFDFI